MPSKPLPSPCALAALVSLAALLALAVLLSAAAQPADAARPAAAAPGRYIVVYEPTVGSADAETDRQERTHGIDARFRYRRAVRGFAATLTAAQVEALRADSAVAYVVPDRPIAKTASVPIAPGERNPTGVRRIQAATTSTVRQQSDHAVAVLDTGVDLAHHDLNVADGTNCVAPGTPAQDDDGHGTHVAGTIAARNNGAGVVGVAPGTRLYSVKVLDANGDGTWSQLICGLDWVAANAGALGIGVANMSLGGPGAGDSGCGTAGADPLHQALCRLTAGGVTPVVAAGNDARDLGAGAPDVPAAYPESLTVTAMSDNDGRAGGSGGSPTCRAGEADDAAATFSNYATAAADLAHMVAAPGVCIRSSWPGGGTRTLSGTSMAAPHVAGVVALCLSEAGTPGACAGRTPAQIVQHLRTDAELFASFGLGFAGDPLRPSPNGRRFGFLSRAGQNGPPPDTAIVSGPSGLTNAPAPAFAFSATRAGGRFECRLDSGPWLACASRWTAPVLADGDHALEVRAVDLVGGIDPSPARRTLRVDTVAPAVTLIQRTVSAGELLWGTATVAPGDAGSVDVTIHPGETTEAPPVQAVTAAVEDGRWTTEAPPLPDGTYTALAKQRDEAGNAGFSAPFTFAIVTPPPPPAPRPPAAPATPARLTLKVPRQRLATVLKRGLDFSVPCAETCTLRAWVSLDAREARRVRLTRRAKGVTVGSGAWHANRARVRISRAAADRLRALRQVRLTLKVTVISPRGDSRTLKRAVTLTR